MKRKHEKKTKGIVKDISLTTAILTVIFMALIAVYQHTASDKNLAEELSISFSNYGK